MCLLVMPTRTYGMTENSIAYLSKGEIGEVSSAEIVLGNSYGDLQPGEYFTINLIGAEFDIDDNGDPKISSYNVKFDKRTKTSVTGMLLGNVEGRAAINIRFSSKILANEAVIEIEGDDSHISSGKYTYATTPESDMSHKGEVKMEKERFFYDKLELGPITIKEQANSAFRSLMVYEYDTPELIRLEVPKGEYEFYETNHSEPITIIIEDHEKNETRYELGKNSEVNISPNGNILTFLIYDQDFLQPITGKYTIRIENLKVKANKTNQKKDVYMSLGGKLLDEKDVLIGNQVMDELVFESSTLKIKPGQEQRVKFVVQEGKGNTLLKANELSFGLTGNAKINYYDHFKLKVIDGAKVYELDKPGFKVKEDEYSFTISDFTRANKTNSIRIEGEFTVQIPEKVERDIEIFLSDREVPGVIYKTVFDGYEVYRKPKIVFAVNKDTYTMDGESHLIDAKPYISLHNRIMVPLRYVAFALGVDTEDLKWDSLSKTITLKGDRPMTINAETGQMIIDDKSSNLSEITLEAGRTFVPIGEIARAFGSQVKWNPESRTAIFN